MRILWKLLGLAVIQYATALPGHAASFCVATAGELQQALTTAESNGEDDVIRIAAGTYRPTDPAGFQALLTDACALAINGGYEAGTGCSVQLRGADWTNLDGSTVNGTNNTRVLRVQVAGTGAAPFSLRDLTFRNGKGTDAQPFLAVNGTGSWGGDIVVENISVRDNEMAKIGAYFESTGRIIVRSSEFVRNSGTSASSSVLSLVANGAFGSGSGIYFNNNTLAANEMPTSNSMQQASLESSGDVHVGNSIVFADTARDLFFNGAHLYVKNSNIRGIFSVTGQAAVSEDGTYVTYPSFVSADNFQLQPASPLIGGGSPNVVGGSGSFDVSGAARVDARIDVGAYEFLDTLLDSGFEHVP